MTPHWVWATSHEGYKIPVNLGSIHTMHRCFLMGKDGKPTETEVTILYLGGVVMMPNGTMDYAKSLVRETPAELFAMPKIKLGGTGGGRKGLALPGEEPKKAARTLPRMS